MRRKTIGLVCVCVVTVAACGNSTKFANKPRPATPVNLSVYINNARVSISPTSVGAGPINFIVTNAADHAESLSIVAAGSSSTDPVADTGPINPQATAQVTVDFGSPGDYTVTTGSSGGTDASLAQAPSIRPATLHIGQPRPSASNQLLQP